MDARREKARKPKDHGALMDQGEPGLAQIIDEAQARDLIKRFRIGESDQERLDRSLRSQELIQAMVCGDAVKARALIAQGADIEQRCHRTGFSALITAAYNNSTNALRVLLDAGAKPDGRSDTGSQGTLGLTAVMIAASRGHVDAVRLLAPVSDLTLRSNMVNGGAMNAWEFAMGHGPHITCAEIIARQKSANAAGMERKAIAQALPLPAPEALVPEPDAPGRGPRL